MDMRYNIAQLLKDEAGQTREYQLHAEIGALDPDIVPLTTLDGTIKMIRTLDGVLAMGKLRASIELTCSRCAEPFAMPLQFSIEEEFRSSLDIVTGASLPVPEEYEPATLIDEHHEIDLTEVIRQDMLLAFPPFPLCRSKCAGLCPECGKNWNDGPCECKHADIDPRFYALKELLEDKSERI